MTDEIAFKAVDYLVASSSENETLAIVFFGGEPMINEPLIWKTVDYSKGSVRPGLTYMCPHGAISLTP